MIKEYLKLHLVTKNIRIIIFRFGPIFVISKLIHFYKPVHKICFQHSNFIKNKPKFHNKSLNIFSENLSCENIINTIKELLPNLDIKILDSKIINQISNSFLFCGFCVGTLIIYTVEALISFNVFFTFIGTSISLLLSVFFLSFDWSWLVLLLSSSSI